MAEHHTKDKGDLGVAKAYADLVERGFLVLFPSTEHAPFDLVAYRDGQFRRIQVKFRAAKGGRVIVDFSSKWSDRHGVHAKAMNKAEIDLICIYCPDTNECYYVRPTDFRESVSLRVTPALNNQKRGVLPASGFRELPV